jgi:hypothetical protein
MPSDWIFPLIGKFHSENLDVRNPDTALIGKKGVEVFTVKISRLVANGMIVSGADQC